MDDRPTQFVLGIFIATFLFSLIVLMRVGDDAELGRVPGLGVTLSAGLAIVALGSMIHFFDHVSKRLQADSLISELGKDLLQAATLHVSQLDASELDDREIGEIEGQFEDKVPDYIAQPRSGYLRLLDVGALCRCAKTLDAVIRVDVRQGTFVMEGQRALSVLLRNDPGQLTSEACTDLSGFLLVAPKRTPEASINFEISALVEVALRALSPGINDPFTALACINHLADGLRILAAPKRARQVHRDDNGAIRLLQPAEPFERYLAQSFDPILECSKDNTAVRDRLLWVTTQLHELSEGKEARRALERLRERIAT
jgi:uncharacterized membrane protein